MESKREEGSEVLSGFESGLTKSAGKRNRSAANSSSSSNNSMYDDIEEMMFGFGDKWPPNEESVNLVESIVTNYIEDLTARAVQVSELRGKLDKECFMFVVRKDRRKFSRINSLLKANEELKAVQKEELAEPEEG